MSKETEGHLDHETVAPLEGELERLSLVREEIARVVVGQEGVIDQLLISLLCGGHVLVEGAPGLGKTLLVRTLGMVCGLEFSRIQFTPDLMPADITGTIVLIHDDRGETHSRFQRGPIFAQMVLTDEINRATPKTQSALLEAMQERTVTAAGEEFTLPAPFFVLATQNPIEMEGTYQLPEAQIDRFFFKVKIPYPSEEVLGGILDLTTGVDQPEPNQILKPEEILRFQRLTRAVPMASHVQEAVVKFVLSTQPDQSHSDEVRRFVRHGVSPRGAQALILASKAHALLLGRYNVSFEDLEETLLPALRHRFQLNFEGEAEGVSAEDLLSSVFKRSLAARA
ncbi:MAG: MoxR family ATPase [Truepera sp.]|nr:MoxR family ATPase [Truepera sp.]